MLSSAIGILIGDFAWLEGLRLLGVRNIIVMDSLKPFLAAVFGWALLGEQLQWAALGGIACTVLGILLVSLPDVIATNTVTEEEQRRAELEDSQPEMQLRSTTKSDTAAYSMIQDVDASKRSERTTRLAEYSTLSLATGSFPVHSSNDDVEVTVFVDPLPPVEAVVPQATTTTVTVNVTMEHAPQYHDRDQPQHAGPRDGTNATKRANTLLDYYYGYGMAILNVLLDTYGSVLTKQHGTKFTTWEINLVRFGFAGIVMLLMSLALQLRDWWRMDNSATNDEEQGTPTTPTTTTPWYKLPQATMSTSAWLHVVTGVLFVTFFTPALSNYALFQIALALALTLGSVGPLYALPLTYLLQKDQKRPTLQACLGAMLTVGGIVILAFWGTLE
jgi:drug/metabolite transporter (DMT)-like permease